MSGMKEQIAETVQHAATSKGAMVVGVATGSLPTWIDHVIQGSAFQAFIVVLGVFVSISIVAINIQSFLQRTKTNKEVRRQERIRTSLLERQAKEKGIEVD